MNKIAVAVAAAVVVLAGGFAGATWYAGKQIDQKISQSDTLLKDYPILKVVKRDFKPGFWTSTEDVTYQIGCAGMSGVGPLGGEGVSISLHNVIHHNPFGMAVDTNLVLDEKTRAEMSKVFKDKEPLQISTKIGLGGDMETRLSSPAFSVDENGTKVEWKGLDIVYKYDRDLGFINGDVKMPGLSVSEPGATGGKRFEMGELTYKVDQKRSSEGLMVGSDSLQLAGMTIEDVNGFRPIHMVLGKTVANGETSVQDGFLRVAVKAEADKLQVNKTNVGSFSLDYAMDRLDAKSIHAFYQRSLHDGILQCKMDPAADMLAMKALLVEVLKKDPKIKNTFKLKTAEGEAQVALDLATKGMSMDDMQAPQRLVGKMEGNLSVQLPNALVERMIRESIDPNSVDPQAAEQAQQQFQQSLAMGVSQGYIVNDGKQISSKMEIKGGQLNLNGKPIPLGQ